MWVLRWWALPSAGAWLAAAMILYSCRVLERRTGSNKFVVSYPSCALDLAHLPVGLLICSVTCATIIRPSFRNIVMGGKSNVTAFGRAMYRVGVLCTPST